MTRALTLALVLVAALLAACGAEAARLAPARLSDGAAQAQTATAVWRIVGKIGDWDVDLSIYQNTGGVVATASPTSAATLPPTATAAATLIPTNTPRPSPPATLTITLPPSATPTSLSTSTATTPPVTTQTATEAKTPTPQGTVASTTPAPTLTPVTDCFAGIAASALNVRSGAGTTFGIVGQVHSPDRVRVLEVKFVDVSATRTDEWARITFGPLAGWIAVFYDGGTNAVYDLSEECSEVRFPPPKVGLHLIFSAQSAPVLGLVSSGAIGSLKGTDGSERIVIEAKRRNPKLLTIWRNLATGLGWRDNPALWGIGDPRVEADQWFDAQYGTWKARGLIGVVDFFEYRNEALFIGPWEVAFDLRMLERANAAGVCLAVFSDGYGNPQISEFVQRRAVLDYILAHPCAPGRYHAIAYHTYEGVAGGVWKFGRFSLFLLALGDEKYRAIPWLITEYSYSDGRGAVDCGALWNDNQRAKAEYARWPMIWGYQLYSVGPGTVWQDVTPCFDKLAFPQ